MTLLTSALSDNSGSHKLAAATGVLGKKENPTEFGGYTNFDANNRFLRYQQLIKSTPFASIGLKKLKISLTKGMEFDGRSKRQVEEFEKWSRKTNFIGQVQTIAGNLFRDGTYAGVPNKNPEKFKLTPLLMGYTTILPAGVEHNKDPGTIMQPEAKEFVIHEGGAGINGNAKEQPYPAEDIVYGVVDEWDSIQLDIKNRRTNGLYGESLVDPIELSIRYLHIINQGYVEYVRKYGMGRYTYSFPFMEMLVEKGIITFDTFQEELEVWMEKNKHISQNEDIVGIAKVTPVDAMGSLNVMEFKTALETDIQLGLLQSDISMGDSKGSTYAAGYVSEADRMVVLEGLQKVLTNVANDAINRRLALMNKPQDSVEVTFQELSLPQLTAQDMLEWCNTGVITVDELREWGGFPSKEVSEA